MEKARAVAIRMKLHLISYIMNIRNIEKILSFLFYLSLFNTRSVVELKITNFALVYSKSECNTEIYYWFSFSIYTICKEEYCCSL